MLQPVMKQSYILLFLLFSIIVSTAQSRLVLNGAHLRLANGSAGSPACLVIDNNNPDAITRTSNGGCIISEGEFNRIKWNLGTAMTDSATYWFHLGNTALNWIPFKFKKNSAGAGSGTVTVSSWYSASNAVWPSGTSLCGGAVENDVTDRFWLINVDGYTTNPSADVSFYYDPAENDGIPENDLQMQKWNSSCCGTYSCKWETPPVGTVNTTDNNVLVSNINSFSPWAMSRQSIPLPIELTAFTGECNNGKIALQWETASEINNDFFDIERSINGEIFKSIGVKNGGGNSNARLNYSFIDDHIPANSQILYYRLKQTDFDGTYTYSDIFAVQNCRSPFNGSADVFLNENNQLVISIVSSNKKKYNVCFFDITGRKTQAEVLNIRQGNNLLLVNSVKLAAGIYSIVLYNEKEFIARKIVL